MPGQNADAPTPVHLFSPIFGFAQQAQIAMADATMATWRGTLQNAQSAMQTAQQAIDAARHISVQSGEVIERTSSVAAQAVTGAVPVGPAAGKLPEVSGAIQDAAHRSMDAVQEISACASKRAQAYMELPNRLAQCKSPQDVVSEQMRFWQTAAQHYTETSQRMMSMWGVNTPARPKVPSAQQILAGKGVIPREPRDMVTFREPPTNGDGRLADGSPRRVS